MWLIDRHSGGLGKTRIPLPVELRSALVRWYIGEGSRHDEDAGIMLVQQARIGAKWIACDCLGAETSPPILTPAFLSEAETYYLRRLTNAKRPEHRSTCPFFRDQVTNRITETRSALTPADSPVGYFEVLRPAPEKLAQRPLDDASDDRTRSASVPRLARLLWRLLNNAGLNIAPPMTEERAERSIVHEFRALVAAAAKIEIAPGIELGRALWTHGDALHSKRAYASIRELSRRWPPGHAPQGFLTLFAPEFKGTLLKAAGCEPLTIANRIQSPSVRGNRIQGPYLVIVVLGEYPEARGYAPLRAYAQPIYSGNRFMPVESDFERVVLRAILGARRAFDRAGIDLAIEKPVFDILTPLGSGRPDFIVEARSRRSGELRQIIVQAMGGSAPNYLALKAGVRRTLEQIAPVVEVALADIEDGRLTRRLFRTLTRERQF
ncbi:hypothetical protein [Sphingomonas morindae]|uniref:DUF1173 domain-containing protein n=1 Tax=Sphingomonas morindae TaxID=1541170 RepID=A0ABY4XE53_9SPHN|nr:hypothetical protein [Sphingomonas morindae]USI75123.1 hypothetical protein LHA26_19720 [Sphingomonas morindae]